MNGRLEHEQKLDKLIKGKLQDLPSYVSEWVYVMRASNKTLITCNDFVNKLRNFISFINPNIKKIKLEDFTAANISKYFIKIQTKKDENGNIVHTSDTYKQAVWICLNNFFNFMVMSGYLNNNPINTIAKPKNNDLERINQNRVQLTKFDFNRIINAVQYKLTTSKTELQTTLRLRDLAIVLLFMTTGIRKTALTEINTDDFDYSAQVLRVIDKGNRSHKYFLSQKTMDAINEWLSARKVIIKNSDNDALFVTELGQRMSGKAIYQIIDKYSQIGLGYHISPHKLRAGFCSIMFQETGNIEFVRRAVGHSNVATTQRYIVTDNNEREVASEIMNNLISL